VTSSASGLEIAPHPAQFLILPPIPSTLRPNFNNPIPEDLDIQTAQEWQDFDTLFGDPISDPHRNTEANDIPISHGIWVPSSTRLEGTGSIIPLSDELFEQVVNDVEDGETEQAPPTSPSTILHKASICNKLGHVFFKAGHFSDALDCYESAYATASETFGHQHPNTLNILHNMGVACSELGDNYTAHIYLTHVLEEKEIVLKTNDPTISETQRQLGIVCYRQGNYAESQKFLEHALVVKERVLGHDHPSTLDITHELGFLYCKQENYSLGYRYFQRAVSGRKKILGRGHSETLDSIMYLGSTLCYLKQYEEAFAWYDKELIAQNEELVGSGILSGDLRTNYIKAIVSMSIICCRLGYFDKGQECFHYISSLLGEETDQWVTQLDYPMHSDDDRR